MRSCEKRIVFFFVHRQIPYSLCRRPLDCRADIRYEVVECGEQLNLGDMGARDRWGEYFLEKDRRQGNRVGNKHLARKYFRATNGDMRGFIYCVDGEYREDIYRRYTRCPMNIAPRRCMLPNLRQRQVMGFRISSRGIGQCYVNLLTATDNLYWVDRDFDQFAIFSYWYNRIILFYVWFSKAMSIYQEIVNF